MSPGRAWRDRGVWAIAERGGRVNEDGVDQLMRNRTAAKAVKSNMEQDGLGSLPGAEELTSGFGQNWNLERAVLRRK